MKRDPKCKCHHRVTVKDA
jgi:hypothetical protein